MNDQTRSELQREIQRYLASDEMFRQPQGKIELTPVAQKAIDRYVFTWIGRLVTLFVALTGMAGFVGFKDLAARSEVAAKTAAESAEKTAEEAKVSLATLKANLVMSEKAVEALKKMTSDAQTDAALEADAIVAYFRADLESSKVRLDELYGTVVDGFSDLQLSESKFRDQLLEKRAEWEALDVVKEFRGVADKIAAAPRILEFIQTRMTLNAMPVGSIVGWHKNVEGIAGGRLPEGWVECNGPILPGDQPDWAEGLDLSGVPNLNAVDGYAGGRFLRGSTTSGRFEEDAFQGHWHDLVKIKGEDPPDIVNHLTHTNKGDNGGHIGQGNGNNPGGAFTVGEARSGSHGEPRVGKETRPVNMSVVWIMRVK